MFPASLSAKPTVPDSSPCSLVRMVPLFHSEIKGVQDQGLRRRGSSFKAGWVTCPS